MPIGLIWQVLLENPLINFLIALSRLFFDSYGMAILVFTVVSKIVTFPLTLKTLRSSRKMQELQPFIQEINKKYSDPQKRQQETFKLYKEHNVNVIGCLGPTLIQMPIFIALYAAVQFTLGVTPEGLLRLPDRLYDFAYLRDAFPLNMSFLGMDLGENGPPALGIVVFAAMWLQQRITASRTSGAMNDAQQAAMNNTMLQWMIPFLFGYVFPTTLPAALGLYWGVSTIIGVVLQWVFLGPGDFTWGSLIPSSFRWRPAAAGAGAAGATSSVTTRAGRNGATNSGVSDANASSGSQRADDGGGSGSGPGATGAPPRSGRRRRHPRR